MSRTEDERPHPARTSAAGSAGAAGAAAGRGRSGGRHARPAPVTNEQVGDLLDRITDAHLTLDRDFRVRYLNSAAERALGRPASTLLGRTGWEVWPAAVGSEIERQYRRVVTEGAEAHFTHHYVGEQYDAQLEIDAYPTDEGGVSVFWRDVTARHRVAAEREQARARVETILESITDAFYALDADYRFTYINRKAEEWWQRPRGELLGRHYWTEFPNAVGSESYERHVRAMTERTEMRYETVSPILDRWVSVTIFPDAAGGLACYFQDISERKRAEEERERLLEAERAARAEATEAQRAAEEARRAAEDANRAKSEFLAVMSHELRTPLNAIGGYAQLIELGVHGPVTEAQCADLERIRRNQQHLLGLINDVLHFARLDAGRIPLDCVHVPLLDAVTGVESLVRPQVLERRHTLDVAACDPALTVWADPERLTQILVNLLTNAVKYTTPGGRITVSCAAADPEAGAPMVRVTVRDTGIGIAPDKLEAIFDPFVQVGRRLNRPSEGVGLGLAISRDLARKMGGDLTVESRPGAGSAFTLSLPPSPAG